MFMIKIRFPKTSFYISRIDITGDNFDVSFTQEITEAKVWQTREEAEKFLTSIANYSSFEVEELPP